MKIYLSRKILLKIHLITESVFLDFIGLGIVLFGSIKLGFHKTTTDLDLYFFTIKNYPVGIQSIISTCISLMVTRLVTKRNNLGNFIGTLNIISVCLIDYMLGNKAAFITYPVSFFGNYYAYRQWKKHSELIPVGIDKWFFVNFIFGFLLSFLLNFIGYTNFLTTKNLEIQNMELFLITSIVVGLTFGGQFNAAKKYKDNWFAWQIYNVFKFVQNIKQNNIAQLLKYSFYFLNAVLAWVSWTFIKQESDKKKNI